MSALPLMADMLPGGGNVRFVPITDLCTQQLLSLRGSTPLLGHVFGLGEQKRGHG
jgi:hypothetical protein